eukprot:2805091-Prorocentrum_lima.AAC.1
MSALRTQLVLAHEDASAGGLAVHTAPLLHMVLDKDLAMVTVSEEMVPAPEARAWLNCECALHLSVHAGR